MVCLLGEEDEKDKDGVVSSSLFLLLPFSDILSLTHYTITLLSLKIISPFILHVIPLTPYSPIPPQLIRLPEYSPSPPLCRRTKEKTSTSLCSEMGT
ncbi:hypothetical protein PIB30_063750 [Stylosanthes scabra]|uniref:Uncharacterized protein n=1 Tax=Stylosanthes scabra TaxID=79078 RepID=A0ABU6SME2_9FABA|nr:hypothetical protein [Stylosanthes scabra]